MNNKYKIESLDEMQETFAKKLISVKQVIFLKSLDWDRILLIIKTKVNKVLVEKLEEENCLKEKLDLIKRDLEEYNTKNSFLNIKSYELKFVLFLKFLL